MKNRPPLRNCAPGGKTATAQMSRSLSTSTLSSLIESVPVTAAQSMVPSNREQVDTIVAGAYQS